MGRTDIKTPAPDLRAGAPSQHEMHQLLSTAALENGFNSCCTRIYNIVHLSRFLPLGRL